MQFPVLHIKSGRRYTVVGKVVDSTNAVAAPIPPADQAADENLHRVLVIYVADGGGYPATFARELGEFNEKFALLNGGSPAATLATKPMTLWLR